MDSEASLDAVVAGHICVDVTLELDSAHTDVSAIVCPGRLTHVGPARLSLGGVVANTGLALHHLGVKTALRGLIGDDWLGEALLSTLRRQDPLLAESMRMVTGRDSSYAIVISPPDVDRAFLHCPGANDFFAADDLDLELIRQARWLHFGYPPLMQGVSSDCGRDLASQFSRIQQAGVLVSLDMAMPDANAISGKVPWREWLSTVLPYVDLFAPTFDEIMWMLHRPVYDKLAGDARGANLASVTSGETLSNLARERLGLGVPIVAIKLGDQGWYMRTATDLSAIAGRTKANPFAGQGWSGRELLTPCFQVAVVSTTGAGDCTLAGLLSAILRGQSIEEAMLSAVRVGAWRVQSRDAECAIPAWEHLATNSAASWLKLAPTLDLRGWSRTDDGFCIGPQDRAPASGHSAH